jgi:hypothetical protein
MQGFYEILSALAVVALFMIFEELREIKNRMKTA